LKSVAPNNNQRSHLQEKNLVEAPFSVTIDIVRIEEHHTIALDGWILSTYPVKIMGENHCVGLVERALLL